MFGKTKCKICGDQVRLVLKHLREKHPEIYEKEVVGKSLQDITKKFFMD